MRRVKIFAGSSHPALVESICTRLGTQPAKCELGKFSNGETSVSIATSIRDQDVFIVQSGSNNINDSVMELLIMINACKGGSARSVTAVLPYFPYSRQSKKKSHRGAITARMLANLLSVAGVSHVITVDLHASQMQGFFHQPVDNLYAEPLIARWIRNHVPGWQQAVVVSKNPGGTKRVTSLADALKLSFGIVTTDRRRPGMSASMMLDSMCVDSSDNPPQAELDENAVEVQIEGVEDGTSSPPRSNSARPNHLSVNGAPQSSTPTAFSGAMHNGVPSIGHSPLARSTRIDSISSSPPTRPLHLARAATVAVTSTAVAPEEEGDEYTDERARDVITGRLIHGHIVDDDYPSPTLSAASGSVATMSGDKNADDIPDPMTASFLSIASSKRPDHALGGTYDAAAMSDEEDEAYKDPEIEHTVTLVGNVKDRTVFIVDDMIDKADSWIAAAETVVKRGGAKRVYCIATHGLFGDNSLQTMEDCECIDHILVTNSFPISPELARSSRKLVVLDLSNLLAEAIRRNHYGESISQLFVSAPE
ncbi:ribose-phosphate diphosphokinase [Xylona heveae TC161]|uniref:Ribose-phosphate pyrophosphokinase 1 n=1 Tax=Xylona heveae (strain CBS 132557 / TC161) TaxID=1328760 RepID=A0A165HDI2_XYLHT|nr:ribose-phosphate diphosphokinase [Xylona heveae TC161]KZF23344.1 ribose-phosphate diphosphokinase [Xylona heveae TC161]